MRVGYVIAGSACLALVSACGNTSPTTSKPPAAPIVQTHHGSLNAADRSLATTVARQRQRTVTGTFIGATAFRSVGTPLDPGSMCDVRRPYLNIRLVWKADANFIHSWPPMMPGSHTSPLPDGPRKALLITVDEQTHAVCEVTAMYRSVGAREGETLLYGRWPSRADG